MAVDFASEASGSEIEASEDVGSIDAVVFKVSKLPKKCQVHEDPEGVGVSVYGSWDSWIVKGCGCVKPTHYCSPDFEKPKPEWCKWKRI